LELGLALAMAEDLVMAALVLAMVDLEDLELGLVAMDLAMATSNSSGRNHTEIAKISFSVTLTFDERVSFVKPY
jgi:hypothetical protein